MNHRPSKARGGPAKSPYVLSISSGKGGVGKTNAVINLAVEIQRRGLRVLVFDADMGLSNVPILLGVSPDYDISHVLFGNRRMREVLFPGPGGITLLSAGFGIQELSALNEEQQLRLLCETEELEESFDVVLIDTGAGIASNVIFFNIVSHDNVVVICPEPAAMSDAYVLMKILALRHQRKSFKILLNRIREPSETDQILERIGQACQRFLGVSLELLDSVPYDPLIPQAVRQQMPVVEYRPQSPSSQCFSRLAEKIVAQIPDELPLGSLQLFWKRHFDARGSDAGATLRQPVSP